MSEYEFNASENMQFLKFSQSLIYLSISLLFAGVIILIQGIISPSKIVDVITGIVFIAVAISLFLPVQYFQNIIVTTGNDIDEFMKGFSFLSKGLTFVIGLSGILLISIAIGIILNIFF